MTSINAFAGCKVLAFAGNPAKLKWLKEDLKFDHVFDYKKVDLDKTFAEFAPQGIDCYFDNVSFMVLNLDWSLFNSTNNQSFQFANFQNQNARSLEISIITLCGT